MYGGMLWDIVSEKFNAIWTTISTTMQRVWDTVVEKVTGVWNSVSTIGSKRFRETISTKSTSSMEYCVRVSFKQYGM